MQVNNNAQAIDWASRLYQHVTNNLKFSPAAVAAFSTLRIRAPAKGFHVTSFPLWQLGCLLGETWLEEDVLNAMAELLYFRNSAKHNDSSFVYLPTSFFSDAKRLYESSPRIYNSNMLDLRLRLSIRKATRIASMMWEGNHYSSTFYQCEGSYEHGDSLMRSPPANAVNIFQWLLQGLDPMEYTPPSTLVTGEIGLQLLGGAGSCAVAAHNFVETKVDSSVPLWEAAASARSRQSILRDLIIYQLAAVDSPVCNVIATSITSQS